MQKLTLYDKHRRHKIPALARFIQSCRSNGKAAVVEVKSDLSDEQTGKMIQIIDNEGYLEHTIFISFNRKILTYIREKLPEQPIQLLMLLYKQEQLDFAKDAGFGISINHRQLTKERVEDCRNRGIEVNCWTVNSSQRAALLRQWGVDYITTDKLIFDEKHPPGSAVWRLLQKAFGA